ncbi:MAG: phenylacetate--CoA ligase family protein, partial [Rhodospirillaceae bacterium]
MTKPTYFEALDYERMVREYPIGDAFAKLMKTMSRDELTALQETRLLKLIDRGWKIPFYQRLWSAAGMAPGDIKRLEDSAKIPSYSKADLMKSIEEHPPFGDFHGMENFAKDKRPPVVFNTTTGKTRPPPNF